MENSQNILQRFALRVSDWSEKWFPDSYIFALLGVVIVAIASISIGAPAKDVAVSFGDGFWRIRKTEIKHVIVTISLCFYISYIRCLLFRHI